MTVKAPVTLGHGLDSAVSRAFTSPVLLNALKASKRPLTPPVLRKPSDSLQYAKTIYTPTRQRFGWPGQRPAQYPVFVSGTGNCGPHIIGLKPKTILWLVCESTLQMGFIVRNMRINFGKHGTVGMAHDGGNCQVVMPLDKLAGSKAVTGGIGKHLLANDLGDTQKPITNSVLRPSRSSLIQEKFARAIFGHKSVDDFKQDTLKVDYALTALPFRLFRRENDTFFIEFDMPRLYSSRLLRSASRVPNEKKQVAERIAFRKQGKNLLEVVGLHIDFTTLCRRLLHTGKRSAFKMPLLYRPIPDTLYGNNSAPAIGAAPCGLTIYPFRDAKRLDGHSVQIGNAGMIKEIAEITAVPFERARSPMFFAPSKILRNERMNCNIHALQPNHILGNVYLGNHGVRQALDKFN